MKTHNILSIKEFKTNIGTNCRIMGIDPGKKNIGIAICDENQKVATPIMTIKRNKFDLIILSPGININKCKLKNFLRKNLNIIYTDLDVFYSFYKNVCITITGTNGKSTTCKLLYEVLKKSRLDVKLAGNIGYPILSVKNIKRKSILIGLQVFIMHYWEKLLGTDLI